MAVPPEPDLDLEADPASGHRAPHGRPPGTGRGRLPAGAGPAARTTPPPCTVSASSLLQPGRSSRPWTCWPGPWPWTPPPGGPTASLGQALEALGRSAEALDALPPGRPAESRLPGGLAGRGRRLPGPGAPARRPSTPSPGPRPCGPDQRRGPERPGHRPAGRWAGSPRPSRPSSGRWRCRTTTPSPTTTSATPCCGPPGGAGPGRLQARRGPLAGLRRRLVQPGQRRLRRLPVRRRPPRPTAGPWPWPPATWRPATTWATRSRPWAGTRRPWPPTWKPCGIDPGFVDAYNNASAAAAGPGPHGRRRRGCSGRPSRCARTSPSPTATWATCSRTSAGWRRPSRSFRRALELDPGDPVTHSNLAYAVSFLPGCDARRDPAREPGRGTGPTPAAGGPRPTATTRTPGAGCASATSPRTSGSTASPCSPSPCCPTTTTAGSRSSATPRCPRPDAVTRRIAGLRRRLARHRRRMATREVADLVRADRIDILVDLTMHMSNGRPRPVRPQARAGAGRLARLPGHHRAWRPWTTGSPTPTWTPRGARRLVFRNLHPPAGHLLVLRPAHRRAAAGPPAGPGRRLRHLRLPEQLLQGHPGRAGPLGAGADRGARLPAAAAGPARRAPAAGPGRPGGGRGPARAGGIRRVPAPPGLPGPAPAGGPGPGHLPLQRPHHQPGRLLDGGAGGDPPGRDRGGPGRLEPAVQPGPAGTGGRLRRRISCASPRTWPGTCPAWPACGPGCAPAWRRLPSWTASAFARNHGSRLPADVAALVHRCTLS